MRQEHLTRPDLVRLSVKETTLFLHARGRHQLTAFGQSGREEDIVAEPAAPRLQHVTRHHGWVPGPGGVC